ncbi:MAG: hypothetical protein AAFV80_18785, partial [Bacteroidota bacterium]
PDIQLNPVVLPPVLCAGNPINLTNFEPLANIAGSYTWYDGDPGNGGQVLSNPSEAIVINGSYWLQFAATADPTCTSLVEVPVSPAAGPSIMQIADPTPICQGEAVDLTALEPSINTLSLPGDFTWFKGDPNQANAVQLTDASAASQFPGVTTSYFAVFTEAGGCSSTVSVEYTVNDLPVLGFVPDQVVCAGVEVNLTAFEAAIANGLTGSVDWYLGPPDQGLIINNPAMFSPSNGDELFGEFTETGGCSNVVSLSFTVNDAPVLTNPGTQDGFCGAVAIDLTAFESTINTNGVAGNFVWYEGSTGDGTLVQVPNNVLIADGDAFSAVFTNSNNCSAFVSFGFEVNDPPALATIQVAPICETDAIDLTSLEGQINNQNLAGSFTWFEGNSTTGVVISNPAQYFPGTPIQICALFTASDNCTSESCFQLDLNPLPVLATLPQFPSACDGVPFDLTAFESDILIQNMAIGLGSWYMDDPNQGGTLIDDPSAILINPGDQYFFQFVSDVGCVNTIDFPVNDLPPISGVVAFYDCAADTLAIDLSNVMGGSFMGGYAISNGSPNQPGQVLPEGSSWSIQVVDGEGCFSDIVSGTVDCVQCSAGSADPIQDNILCCNDEVNLTVSGASTADGTILAWAVSAQADGPVDDEASLQAAADNNLVFLSQDNNAYQFSRSCSQGVGNLPNGEYFFTPVILEDPEIDSLAYDTLSNCIPTAIISPVFSSPTPDLWALQPMVITLPDGSPYNLNDSLAFGLPINQQLIDILGGLPPFDLFSLYDGDPNGNWSISFTNVGTGEFSFDVPDFLAVVDADSCSLITSDQVSVIPGLNGTVQPGETFSVSFQVPTPPADFPSVDPVCGGFGAPVLSLRPNNTG